MGCDPRARERAHDDAEECEDLRRETTEDPGRRKQDDPADEDQIGHAHGSRIRTAAEELHDEVHEPARDHDSLPDLLAVEVRAHARQRLRPFHELVL